MVARLGGAVIVLVGARLEWIEVGAGFSVKDTYNTLKTRTEVVDWHKLAWNRFNTPRAAFHAVLVAQDRLLTKVRLRNMGIIVLARCVLCNEEDETRDHLYLPARFPKQFWEKCYCF
ncbi:hypothetical protein QQ045_011662 [Rhodiola kirilowii]